MLTALNNYFANTPREQVLKDWAEAEKATKDIKSPTIGEFLSWQEILLAERKPLVVSMTPLVICGVKVENPPYVESEMYMGC